MSFGVLFVCTGNICRSPAAAALLDAWADPAAGLEASSAGLSALVGAPIDPPVAAELAAIGVAATDHRARQYEPWMAHDAGLVLTATRAQTQQVLRDLPQALRRVFTVAEFARLADQVDPTANADGAQTVAAVAAMRGRVPTVSDGHDDIADPYHRPRAEAAEAVARLATAVRALVGVFAAPAAPRRRPLPYRR